MSEPRLIAPSLYRAMAPTGAGDPQLPRVDRDWLAAGRVPGARTSWEPMTTAALLDLRAFLRENGSVAAGPGGPWRYTWPRDASFAAVALARTGHEVEAHQVLEFLAGLPFQDAGFAARYTDEGAVVADGRPAQADGCGWVMWALTEVADDSPAARGADVRELAVRCTNALLALVDGGTRLPPPSQDYWELPVNGTTLGTAAPVLAGLRAAARWWSLAGDADRARSAHQAAQAFAPVLARGFGTRYERYGAKGGFDASVAVLLPPFAPSSDPLVERALTRYTKEARRPAGGLAPGSAWARDGNSWTPETALVAYSLAAAGDREAATRWLRWLDAHRTTYGSLPEKVTATGQPAGPAPLAWTSALVLLAVDALGR